MNFEYSRRRGCSLMIRPSGDETFAAFSANNSHISPRIISYLFIREHLCNIHTNMKAYALTTVRWGNERGTRRKTVCAIARLKWAVCTTHSTIPFGPIRKMSACFSAFRDIPPLILLIFSTSNFVGWSAICRAWPPLRLTQGENILQSGFGSCVRVCAYDCSRQVNKISAKRKFMRQEWEIDSKIHIARGLVVGNHMRHSHASDYTIAAWVCLRSTTRNFYLTLSAKYYSLHFWWAAPLPIRFVFLFVFIKMWVMRRSVSNSD